MQAQEIHGDVTFGAEGSPRLLDLPIVVSVRRLPGTDVVTESVSDDDPFPATRLPVEDKIRVFLEARSAQAVILHRVRARVLFRRPPRRPIEGQAYFYGTMQPRAFRVDLDTDVPRVEALGVDLPYTITASDPELFEFFPRTTIDEVVWRLELHWIYAGENGTTVIPDDGGVFQTYPYIKIGDFGELPETLPWEND
ncbi:hypothetical protein K7711_46065 [Nocardia sp. CA2R105]|uniref:hypothetical protein n=1 Tax=Nocardia coffeae TaxID=2873381 RepID=UPI001CA6E7F9|nr:hypothetical protein [Nocardia coffeae]MBY8863898.1 hypothetical protein [Nocardia coffeae]